MKLKRRTWAISKEPPVQIVADAVIATGRVGEGRLFPLLIIDTTHRPDLEELIRVHQHFPPGDVQIRWGLIEGRTERVGLLLSFERPIELAATLEFDVIKQGVLVDQILATHGVYLQAGRQGERFLKNPNAPKILLEIPETGFGQTWDDMFYRHIMKHMRKSGLSRPQAKQAACEYIKQLREFLQFRMGQRRQANEPTPSR